jgi:cytochrome P450
VIAALQDMKTDQHDFTPVLEAQVNNGKRQGVEQTVAELAANGIGSIIAGTDTTGMALAIGIRSIYLDEDVRSRLHAELRTVWEAEGIHPSLQDLESLPYLRACVRECLRFSSPISGRLPRITPHGGLDFAGHHIPAGTTISSAVYLMHYNEEIFHEPFRFNPDRWLAQDTSRQEQCLVPFSTGSRACIGLNIATAELYIGLATMVRWFKASRVLDQELNTLVHFTRSVPGGLKVELVEAEQ